MTSRWAALLLGAWLAACSSSTQERLEKARALGEAAPPDRAAEAWKAVLASVEHPGEGRSPRPAAHHDDPHERLTKSIETGTPARLNRFRSSFSTQ